MPRNRHWQRNLKHARQDSNLRPLAPEVDSGASLSRAMAVDSYDRKDRQPEYWLDLMVTVIREP